MPWKGDSKGARKARTFLSKVVAQSRQRRPNDIVEGLGDNLPVGVLAAREGDLHFPELASFFLPQPLVGRTVAQNPEPALAHSLNQAFVLLSWVRPCISNSGPILLGHCFF